MEGSYQSCTLPNGIRIVHRQVAHTQVAHCGFILDVGSRDEKPSQQGIAHFWEHMAFKGTRKRKAFHIINRLESVGGELNAYTTKEKICFYASFLDRHYAKAVELLSDITFDSVFPENQIERERNVILEEMAMYLDSPDDALQDEFDSLVFPNHPLGHNILGTTESVQALHREDFRDFIRENINTQEIVFASVGNLPFKQVLKLAERYIAPVPALPGKKNRRAFDQAAAPQQIQKTYPANQAYCAIGRTAYSLYDPRRIPFIMLTNLLGGPGLNARFNLALREKFGYVYSVEANYTPYTDTGIFAIYFATEEKYLEKSLALIYKELKNLRENKLGVIQLHQAKEQLLGQLAMAEESNLNFMLMMGKSLLDLNGIETLEDVYNQIHKITASEIQDIANELLREEDLHRLLYLPA
ncbi:MAG: insulinase family protein [Bacteroidia bacterium]|nr:insulinase family protein [Bacteroidia bacterium]